MGLLFASGSRRIGMAMLRRVPIVRWIGPSTTLIGVAALAFFVLTGRIDLSRLDSLTGAASDPVIQPVSLQTLGSRSNETIRIATFNIQVFGDKKSQDENVMRVLAYVVSQFDLVAVQEVRGGNDQSIRRLVDLINRSGGSYASIVSEPIGRTSQTSSYAYVWDQSRIMMQPNSAYVVYDDPKIDRMHREPMVASFQVRPVAADGRIPFSFTLINAHTDPDEVRSSSSLNELDVLDDVFVRVRQYEYETRGEEDCILLGDLNVATRGLSELGRVPNLFSVAGDVPTNTRRTETYDHIMIDRTLTTEYSGRFGVLDFEKEVGLTPEQALLVSDHQPVWAEFSAFESMRPAAIASGQPQATAATR